MAYLFDTDTISAVLRPRPDLGVARRLATVAADKQFTSAITLGELLFGALRRQRADLIERIQAIADTVPVLPSTSQRDQFLGGRGNGLPTVADVRAVQAQVAGQRPRRLARPAAVQATAVDERAGYVMQVQQIVAHLVGLAQTVPNGIDGVHRVEQPIGIERLA